ncbi:unnamed protein product, partial [Symbiodinium sp. KB8]
LGYSLSLSVEPRSQRSRRKGLEILSGERTFQVIRCDIHNFQRCVETEKISTINGYTFKINVPDIWAEGIERDFSFSYFTCNIVWEAGNQSSENKPDSRFFRYFRLEDQGLQEKVSKVVIRNILKGKMDESAEIFFPDVASLSLLTWVVTRGSVS